MRKKNIPLILILLLASVLRLWQLGKVPPSPDWDEAALGYNAYSIMKTGRDEYGKFLPLILRSFDDYKPALYAYLAILPIKIFGLNTFAVRLPSSIFGVLTVLATYYLVKELFGFRNKKTTHCALLSAALLAISPWHLQFSRVAFEANVGLAFNIFGLLFFLKGLKGKNILLYLSAIFFSLGFYVYQSEKVFVPLMLGLLILIYRREIWQYKWRFLKTGVLFCAIAIPLFWATFTTPNALLRAKGVSVFSDQTQFLAKSVERLQRDKKNNYLLGFVLDNRRIIYLKSFINGYLSHFDFNWLFVSGDKPRHQPPGIGHLYLWTPPFLLIGLYQLIFGNFYRKTKILLFGWILLTPLPAAFTIDIPHPIRTLNFLPTFQIFTTIGILVFMRWLYALQINRIFKFLIVFLNFAFFTFNFIYYLDQYFIQQNIFYSEYWQHGFKEAVDYVRKHESDYRKIVISNKNQAYMFFLYYLQYSPKRYLEAGGTDSGGFAERHSFAKYEFRSINWSKEEYTDDILYVGKPKDFPTNVPIRYRTHYLNGNTALVVVRGS